MRTPEVLLKLAFEELKRACGDMRRLPRPMQVAIRVTQAQNIIGNGGFQYFFENSFEGHPPYSTFVDAYREAGAIEAAARIERAVSLFPFGAPHWKKHSRNAFLDSMPKLLEAGHFDHEFNRLSSAVCCDKTVRLTLARYMEEHASEFVRSDAPAVVEVPPVSRVKFSWQRRCPACRRLLDGG